MQKREIKIAALAVVVLAVAVAAVALTGQSGAENVEGVSTFSDEEDFKSYLAQAPDRSSVSIGSSAPVRRRSIREQGDTQAGGDAEFSAEAPSAAMDGGEQLESADGGGGGGAVQRESETNVQVEGIDEPDILKTDDGRLFYSSSHEDETKVVDALPPENMSVSQNLSASGDLLKGENRLVALEGDEITAYDTDGSPEEAWTAELNASVSEARLHDGTVYAVLSNGIDRQNPCPVRPMETRSGSVVVPCEDIHRPDEPTNVDTTYTVVALETSDGEITGRTSFVGSASESVVYVSRNGVYVTYTRQKSETEITLDFALNEGSDLFDEATLDRLEELRSYNLSDRALRVEMESVLNEWERSLDDDERRRMENELENRLQDYLTENLRDFETTKIVRVDTETFEVDATGEVPGVPLNQFALDEHDGDLRIATTVGEAFSRQESENDVYVLNENLERRGEAQGMGEGQRVYSVRFMGDTGYVVTFRQVDPFYVLDLSNPEDPTIEGELKLPGYSSYLHPLEGDRVLGVGEESGQVKAVVFDVSDPTDPTIDDDYVLSEYSSDAVGNHRAFLHDERHSVFFLPGSQAGYVFSYDNGLELEKAVNVTGARRAAYINDYMYVVSDTEVVALDENDWSRVETLEIGERQRFVEPHPIEPVEPMPQPDVDR